MALIDTARAMDDQRFRWRVMAAILVKAKIEFAKTPGSPPSNVWNFAAHMLAQPMSDERTMFAMVATDPAVSEAVVVSETSTVDTEAVLDADIQRAVNDSWATVARKYPTPPVV